MVARIRKYRYSGWLDGCDGGFDPRKICGKVVVVVVDGGKSTSTRRSTTIYSR